jgi:small-conductance mechanosensitive channel
VLQIARAKTFLIAFAVCLVCLSAVQGAQETSRPFRIVMEEWDRSLDFIEQELAQRIVPEARSVVLRDRLVKIRAEAIEVEAEARRDLKPLRGQMSALGTRPPEGQPPEPEEITERRQKLSENIVLLEARIKQAQLVLSRVELLQKDIQARAYRRLVENLSRIAPVPVAPGTVAKAVPELLGHLGTLARTPVVWWAGLSPENQSLFLFEQVPIVLLITVLIGWVLRFALLRWCGHDPAIERPTYARRLIAAIAAGLAYGIVPALILAGLWFRLTHEGTLVTGLFADVLAAICAAAVFFLLAWALPRAVLAPHLPSWRLVPIKPENAEVIIRRVTYLAAVFAIDIFFHFATQSLSLSVRYMSFYLFVSSTLEALGVLLLMQARLWDSAPIGQAIEAEAEPTASPPQGLSLRPFWTSLRWIIGGIAAAVIPISIIGYTNLGAYLINSLVISGAIIGALFLVRGLGREAIGVASRSGVMRDRLAVGYKARSTLKSWFRVLYDLALMAAGVLLVLMIWGVPLAVIASWGNRILAGIEIGNVTISLAEILMAVAVFAVTLIVTRLIQRLLKERVLPQTRFDVGVRHSLSTGFGYLGIMLAAALGIAALGLDLSNLAIIAGALSVGIGFGLQNIVSNFVSGLILLIERPIKVGDWIISGQHEGFVKQINLRATEIETFRRASIIIPNSELLTGALTNWTHKDHYGRVDVPIEVAYGSNAEQVMEIVRSCLEAHEDILSWPQPKVLFRSFGDSGLGFEARGFIANIESIYDVETDLRLAVYAAFAEAGIEIPFPQRDIHIKDPARLARALAEGARPGEARPVADSKPEKTDT